MYFSRIHIKDIDFSDSAFSLIPDNYAQRVPESLKASIQRIGILHPPILKEKTSTSLQVISGRKRLWAASDLGYTSCCCYKLQSDISDIEALNISLEDSVLSHPLSPVEQARYFQKAGLHVPLEETAEFFTAITGICVTPFQAGQKLRLLDLENPLQDSVHEKFLDEKVAMAMAQMSFRDRLTLYDVICSLRLSVSNQKKLTAICRELAGRHRTSILEILSENDARSILEQSGENIPQKAAKFMGLFQEKRFPRLSEAEKSFHEFVSELHVPDNITLSHSPSFEKDSLQMTITFSNQQELLKTWGFIEPYCKPATGMKKS